MGNFLVNGISEYGSQKCGRLLIDILESTPKFEGTSLFSKTGNYTEYLGDNIFSHPFLNNSSYTSYAIMDTSGLPPIDAATVAALNPVTESSTSSALYNGIAEFFSNLFPASLTQTVRSGYQQVRQAVSSVGNYVSGIFNNLISYAKSFVGRVNSDREGNRIFSGGRSHAWCADFVTYCVKKVFGGKLPSDFGSSAVSGLRDWGRKHGCYFEAPFSQGLSAMRNFLKTKVKPGDIMIEKRNGKSHTGIVTYVDPEGKYFKTVEGNASDSVKERTYQADSKTLSGFVSLAQYA